MKGMKSNYGGKATSKPDRGDKFGMKMTGKSDEGSKPVGTVKKANGKRC